MLDIDAIWNHVDSRCAESLASKFGIRIADDDKLIDGGKYSALKPLELDPLSANVPPTQRMLLGLEVPLPDQRFDVVGNCNAGPIQ